MKAWSTSKWVFSKHLENILELLHLLHTLLCRPPGAMARQPIRKYGLTSAGVVGWVGAVGDALSTFVWGLRRYMRWFNI